MNSRRFASATLLSALAAVPAALSLFGVVPIASAQTTPWRGRVAHRWEAFDDLDASSPDAAPWWDFSASALAGPQPQAAGQDLYVTSFNPGTGVYGGATYTVSGNEQWANVHVGYGSGGGTNNGAVTQNANTTMTISGALTLADSYSSSGTYTLNGGTLAAASEQISNLGDGGGTFTQNGGTNSVGSGGVTLSHVNPVGRAVGSGTYNLNAGTLSTPFVANGGGASSTFNFNGGTLQATGNNTGFMGGLSSANIQSGGAFINPGGYAITISQALGGSGALTKNGAGALTLSGNNSYTGGTTFAGGSLNVGSAGALGTSGTLSFTGGTLQYSSANTIDYSDRIANSPGAIAIDTNGQTVGYATALGASNTGGLTKLGAGTLTLTGNDTYTGGTTFAGGTLNVGSAGALGSGTLSFTGGTLQYSSANTTDYSGHFNPGASQAYNVDTNGQNVTFASPLTSSGGSLTKLGTGTLTLSGNNSYTGETNVYAGTLAYAGAGSTASSSSLGLNGGAVDLGGGSRTVSAVFINSPAASGATLFDGSITAASYNFSSNSTGNVLVSANLSSTGYNGLNMTGTGTLTLSGTDMFTGDATTVSAGTLAVAAGANITIQYRLNVDGPYSPATVTLASGGSLHVGSLALGQSATGTFTQTGGSLTLFSPPNQGVQVTVGSDNGTGTYTISGSDSTLTAREIDVGGYDGTFTQNGGTVTTGSLMLGSGGGVGSYYLNGGTLNVGEVSYGLNQTAGLFYFNGGTLQAQASDAHFFDPYAAAFVQGGAIIDSHGFNVTFAQTLRHDSYDGTPDIDGGLTKIGAGTLTLTATNTYTGPTTVNGGTLSLNTNASSLSATSAVVLNNGGTLSLSGSSGTTDRINNAATVTLKGGSTLATSGLSEGAVPTGAGGSGGAAGLGALTLTNTSASTRATFDFGSTQTGSALVFSSLTAVSKGAYVSVLDFTGTASGLSGDNGTTTNDRLLFTSDPGFTTADLANWKFSNDAGTVLATGGAEIAYNGYYEIVPVPEPATWLAGALLVGATGVTLVRRRSRPA